MTAKVRVGGAWRTASRHRIRIAGVWRLVASRKIYVDGAWRTFFVGGPPFTLSANPPSQIAIAFAGIAEGSVVITPTGGTGPYAYSHSIVSWVGSNIPVIANASLSFAFIQQVLTIGETNTCLFQCAVTDATGQSNAVQYEITFTRLEP